MTNPQLGFDELLPAQSQPEVVVNEADRAITAALMGEITIDITVDDDYELQATDPLDPDDEWQYGTIRFTDTGTNLSGAIDVFFPDLDAIYGGPSRPRFFFANETLQTLTVRLDETASIGVAVEPGQTVLLRYDGSDIVEGDSAGPSTAPVVTLAGDTYDLGDLTNGAWHEFTSATAVTITVEENATQPVPTFAEFGIMAAGAGGVTLAEDTTNVVIVPPKGGTLELEQGDFCLLKRRAADVYKLLGETVLA